MSIYTKRLERVRQEILAHVPCDSLIIEDPINLYYFTGMSMSAGKLFIGKARAQLFVDGRYIEECREKSAVPVSLLGEVAWEEVVEEGVIGFDADSTSYAAYLALIDLFKKNPKVTFKPLPALLKRLRGWKDGEEIERLRAAAKLCVRGAAYAQSLLRSGITEKEVAREVEIFWLKAGAQGLSFDMNVSFGANSSKPHHRAGETALQENQLVLIDMGVQLNNYHSDITRVFFHGNIDAKLLEIHEIVAEAQRRALEICRPGVHIGEVDAAAREYIRAKGFGGAFTHGLGHGIGLEVHEWPRVHSQSLDKDTLLEPGMVFTIEPGIYLPGIGGVRLEEMVLIMHTGKEVLTI